MAVLPVGIGSDVAGAGGYQIERSLRFNSADSAYLNRTPASAGNRKTWTWSGWVKRSKLATSLRYLYRVDSTNTDRFEFDSSDRLFLQQNDTTVRVSTQVFRDVSAWYHIVLAVDTTQATANNRYKIYVNGSEITTWTTQVNNAQNTDGNINSTNAHKFFGDGSTGFDGYAAELHFIDGSALDPTSFGEYNEDTGVWQPKAYTGSYGTNGFYLDFSDNSGTTSTTLGADSSGNGNNWTPNNFSVTAGAGNDSLVDSPTRYGTDTGAGGEVRGNYCTFNPLANAWSNTGVGTTTNGNLTLSYTSGNWFGKKGTMAVSSGKWYYEWTNTSGGNSSQCGFTTIQSASETGSGVYRYRSNAEKINTSYTAYGATWSNSGDIVGVALDLDAGTIVFYNNGVSQGTAFSGIPSGTYIPECVIEGANYVGNANFGQRPFAYTAPSGFKALVTTNLPEPTIADGGEYFNTVLYTGNGSTQSITGVGFQPDWVWIKNRVSGSEGHILFDSVRGVNNRLIASGTQAEASVSGVTSFDSDGFSLGSYSGTNTNANAHVAWNWKANGAGVSNTDGTITSTVSANTDSGFSIVTYTGNGSSSPYPTVGHGLGVAPKIYIVKDRSATGQWVFQHSLVDGSSDYMYLDSTAANDNSILPLPTSTVMSVGGSAENTNGNNYVAYCFAPVAGYSAFGSYTGNGSADGPFVYTGFRPAWVIAKRSDSDNSWNIIDATRSPINQANNYLAANSSNAENAAGALGFFDFLSNGFKVRTDGAYINASGGIWIYAAFASNPFAYSLAR
jgi:hypothetical protein